MQKVVPQGPESKFVGIFLALFGSAFIYFNVTSFSDPFFAGTLPFFVLGGLVFVGFGIFLILSKTELIYDDKTIEKRTRFLGFSWSKIVDRDLVRDIGPEAAGLIQRRNHRHHHHH